MIFYSLPRICLPDRGCRIWTIFQKARHLFAWTFSPGALRRVLPAPAERNFNYTAYLLLSMVNGSIDSVYSVAYNCFYIPCSSARETIPRILVSSLIYPLSTAIIGAHRGFCYRTNGLAPRLCSTRDLPRRRHRGDADQT
jgi:hypothetical protein